jgi:hypothetical protein
MAASRPRRAVTLIEAVLFIAVALTLIVGGLVFYRQASTGAMTQRLISLISALSVEMNAIHERTEVPWEGLEAGPILAASGAIPPNALNAAGDGAVAPWDGRMRMILSYGANPGFEEFGDQKHLYHLYDVPPQICSRLAYFDKSGMGALGFPIAMIAIDHSNSGAPYGLLLSPGTTALFYAADGAMSRSDGAAACTAGNGPVWMFIAFAYR